MSQKLYAIDVPVFATVYIKAKSRTKALATLRERVAGTELNTSEDTDSRTFLDIMDDPHPSSKITFSPVMTISDWDYMGEDLLVEKVYS